MAEGIKERFRQQAQGALSLNVAYIGVVNGLFSALHKQQSASIKQLAEICRLDESYVYRWCDAAYAFGYLDVKDDIFVLTSQGDMMRPEAADSLMPMAIQSVLSAHMAERASELMRTGERPGEQVLAERTTVLPWFGPMLESSFTSMFENVICPAIPAFADVDIRCGLVVDLGCGNGWYLRALAHRCPSLRGLGIDGFSENIDQARRLAEQHGMSDRLHFTCGDIHEFALDEPADMIVMNRALHHVWEKDTDTLFSWLRDNLKPDGYIAIWEPAWPDERALLRDPGRQGMAFQNISEHVQGNHFLRPDEILGAFDRMGMSGQVYLFAQGNEVVVVAQHR